MPSQIPSSFSLSPVLEKIVNAMTRPDPPLSASSWETKSIATTDDGMRIDPVGQDVRPRGRIRRSMTACNTCRKLKTRCDLDPRGHACRRCLSLRLVDFLWSAIEIDYLGGGCQRRIELTGKKLRVADRD